MCLNERAQRTLGGAMMPYALMAREIGFVQRQRAMHRVRHTHLTVARLAEGSGRHVRLPVVWHRRTGDANERAGGHFPAVLAGIRGKAWGGHAAGTRACGGGDPALPHAGMRHVSKSAAPACWGASSLMRLYR